MKIFNKDLETYISENLKSTMTIEEIVNQNHGEVSIYVDRGMKGFKNDIDKAISLVPKSAVPNIIAPLNAKTYNDMIGYKLDPRMKMAFGVTFQSDDVIIPMQYATDFIKDEARKMSLYKNDLDGWNRVLEIKKDIRVYSKSFKKNVFQVCLFNPKYKNSKGMTVAKKDLNDKYISKHGVRRTVTETALGVIVHEFGHVYDSRNKVSKSSGWSEIHMKWKHLKDCPLYIKESASEAFSEAFANYFIDKGKDLPDFVLEYCKKNFK
ncbi:hypothetical protein BPT24_198 [Tenacibaculum phage pT24]|uniref:Uncharacterized protein n=1 Tax=Tenacibaculum phage pT24 TaxID=1880590 RepID=A0A1B4XWX8_9CAUD|nr:hypothetical protein HYP10_gp198 [Tenacibaculum phage pT24]BAV39322.1 hypothetical protein BPT24_198 [Tenacibaculum phage pT24]